MSRARLYNRSSDQPSVSRARTATRHLLRLAREPIDTLLCQGGISCCKHKTTNTKLTLCVLPCKPMQEENQIGPDVNRLWRTQVLVPTTQSLAYSRKKRQATKWRLGGRLGKLCSPRLKMARLAGLNSGQKSNR